MVIVTDALPSSDLVAMRSSLLTLTVAAVEAAVAQAWEVSQLVLGPRGLDRPNHLLAFVARASRSPLGDSEPRLHNQPAYQPPRRLWYSES